MNVSRLFYSTREHVHGFFRALMEGMQEVVGTRADEVKPGPGSSSAVPVVARVEIPRTVRVVRRWRAK